MFNTVQQSYPWAHVTPAGYSGPPVESAGYAAPAGYPRAAGCPSCGLQRSSSYLSEGANKPPLPWLVRVAPAGCGCDVQAPAGQASGVTTWWQSEPIRFTGKNYVVGALLGAVVGAGAMYAYKTNSKRR